MATQAREIMRDAATILQDREHVRWTLPELRLWINAGLREIALRKPNAKTRHRVLGLAAGVVQTVPAGVLGLLTITRNVAGPAVPLLGRGAVTMVARADLDAHDRQWSNESVNPPARLVRHAVLEPVDVKTFYVSPSNDGTGYVEAITSEMPTPVPDVTLRNEEAAYALAIDLDDVYANALTDYVVYRAYAKDVQSTGNAERAAMAFRQFGDALGVKLTMEGATAGAGA